MRLTPDQRLAISHWSRATALFAALAMLLFIRQLAPDRVLLPVDAIFTFPPYAEAASRLGVTYPENPLVADTILQNVGWKQHARDQWQIGQAPLWNPYILTGQPFLAAGQNASLYPLGALFYTVPLADAYVVFAVLHFTLAGLFTAMFLAALGCGWTGRLIGGVVFELCGFLVVSVVWPMMVSTAIWLPLLLCVIERVVRSDDWRNSARWVALGIAAVGLQFLAGHLEISFYILATTGAYTVLRLAPSLMRQTVQTIRNGGWLLGMVAAGSLLAAVQIVPFVEAIGQNVRVGQVTFAEVQSYAFDRGQWWTFVLPDFFGNPTHRTYLGARDTAIHSVDHQRPDSTELRRDTEWGKRNYVEGASYLGVTALILAVVGVITRPGRGWPLIVIAIASLCFAFGTPLYALVFFGLPGGNQVHTPFRWVYPWTICLAALAGLGADALSRHIDSVRERWSIHVLTLVVAGFGFLAALVSTVFWLAARGEQPIVTGLVSRWSTIRDGFVDGQSFASYLAPQWLGLGLLLITTAILVRSAHSHPARMTVVLLGVLLAADLLSFGVGFNPAGRRDLLAFEPASLAFLRAQPGPFRTAVLGPEDVLPANLSMRVGLEDIRGYDTIIRRDYVDYLNLIERPGALLYSKVEKLFDERSLSSPLFHALNVGYVLSARPISQPGYELVHSDGMNVYRNTRALPRAFMVTDATFVSSADEALERLRRLDPVRSVVIEASVVVGEPTARVDPAQPSGIVQITHYQAQQVDLKTSSTSAGYLVLMDAYDPGWIAYIDGQDARVLRANRAFRAITVPPGDHEIRMLYRPLTFRVGLLLSGIGVLLLSALMLTAFWPTGGARSAERSPLGMVVRNISAPFAANLLSRVLDLGLALVMFRFLGPSGVGAYTFAIVLTGYLDILAGFGLGTLITRDAAQHPERVATYFGNSLLARSGFWALAALVAWVVIGPLGGVLEVSGELSLAVTLLVLGLLPSGYSAALSALLQARERFDIPALVTVVSAVLKILFGLAVLLAGWGFVGLAAVSIATNLVTALVLTIMAIRAIGLPRPRIDTSVLWIMIVAAYPLMLSQVLNALFFRMDALLLKPLAGDEALGWYSTAYRFIDAFQIIPSAVVLALFPLISRQAEDRAAVIRSATLTLRALLGLAFPIAVGCTLLAEPIIVAFAGPSFVPQSVIALQILIWYLPLSFINGLAQYLLIARGRQKVLTVAFALGVAFNVIANFILIPRFGYQAAAWITVASELVLFIPFWMAMRSERVAPNLWTIARKPVVASLAMALVMIPMVAVFPVAAAVIGPLIYLTVLIAIRGVTRDELRMLRQAL